MTTPPPQGNPFAQGQQQPYGQPPQGGIPQQAGQPGFPAPGAPVPPPARNKFGKKALSIAGIIVLAVAIGAAKYFLGQSDAETASVGSCMHNEGTQIKPDLQTVDCSSSDAQYKVVEKFDNTSDSSKCSSVKDAPIAYFQSGGGHDVVLCLKDVK